MHVVAAAASTIAELKARIVNSRIPAPHANHGANERNWTPRYCVNGQISVRRTRSPRSRMEKSPPRWSFFGKPAGIFPVSANDNLAPVGSPITNSRDNLPRRSSSRPLIILIDKGTDYRHRCRCRSHPNNGTTAIERYRRVAKFVEVCSLSLPSSEAAATSEWYRS